MAGFLTNGPVVSVEGQYPESGEALHPSGVVAAFTDGGQLERIQCEPLLPYLGQGSGEVLTDSGHTHRYVSNAASLFLPTLFKSPYCLLLIQFKYVYVYINLYTVYTLHSVTVPSIYIYSICCLYTVKSVLYSPTYNASEYLSPYSIVLYTNNIRITPYIHTSPFPAQVYTHSINRLVQVPLTWYSQMGAKYWL